MGDKSLHYSPSNSQKTNTSTKHPLIQGQQIKNKMRKDFSMCFRHPKFERQMG